MGPFPAIEMHNTLYTERLQRERHNSSLSKMGHRLLWSVNATASHAQRHLALTLFQAHSQAEVDMETLAQRSSIPSSGAPIHDPIDFTLEHAVRVCQVTGYSLVVSAPGRGRVQYKWFTKPKPGTRSIIFYNDQLISGDNIIYYGKWHYLKPPAGGIPKKVSHSPTTKTIALAPISTPAPAPVPQQQRPSVVGGSSNEVPRSPSTSFGSAAVIFACAVVLPLRSTCVWYAPTCSSLEDANFA